MNEALEFFLDEENVYEAIDSPDEAIDYIFMLEDEDLELLAKEWNKRDDEWKTAISYLIGNLKLKDNQKLLIKGLSEQNREIIKESLLALHQSITEDDDEPEISLELKNCALSAIEQIDSEIPEIKELRDKLESA